MLKYQHVKQCNTIIIQKGDIMPNIVSAKKRVQVAKIKTLRNNMIKSSYKSAIEKLNNDY